MMVKSMFRTRFGALVGSGMVKSTAEGGSCSGVYGRIGGKSEKEGGSALAFPLKGFTLMSVSQRKFQGNRHQVWPLNRISREAQPNWQMPRQG